MNGYRPTDKVYNEAYHRKKDAMKIEKLLMGCTIIGSEPCDYPLTDSFDIYLRNAKGKVMALTLSCYEENMIPGKAPLTIELADLPEEKQEESHG